MISLNETRDAQCDARLSLKTQDQTLMRQAMEGAGLTRWEAMALPRIVEDIYFDGGAKRPWKDGQVRYQCVDIKAGPGRKLSDCPRNHSPNPSLCDKSLATGLEGAIPSSCRLPSSTMRRSSHVRRRLKSIG